MCPPLIQVMWHDGVAHLDRDRIFSSNEESGTAMHAPVSVGLFYEPPVIRPSCATPVNGGCIVLIL